MSAPSTSEEKEPAITVVGWPHSVVGWQPEARNGEWKGVKVGVDPIAAEGGSRRPSAGPCLLEACLDHLDVLVGDLSAGHAERDEL